MLLLATPNSAQNLPSTDSVYLSTSFRGNGEDGLRFVTSVDGYRWTEIPGTFLKPLVGASRLMRDPSLVCGPDEVFHLVWTTGWKRDLGFGYASSTDLVQWSQQRFIPVMEYEPATVNVWAPELFYDEPTGRFVICWASTIPGRFPDHQEPRDNNQRMYYATTRDFRGFTPTKLFFDPGFSVIDGSIVAQGGGYVLVFKDNSRPMRNLRVAFAQSTAGPWTRVSSPFTQKFTEGPTVARVGDEWFIYYDAYEKAAYGAAATRDFKSFTDVTDKVSFPRGHKHGTVLTVRRSVVDHLIATGRHRSSHAAHANGAGRVLEGEP